MLFGYAPKWGFVKVANANGRARTRGGKSGNARPPTPSPCPHLHIAQPTLPLRKAKAERFQSFCAFIVRDPFLVFS